MHYTYTTLKHTFAVAPLDSYAERITTGLAYLGGLFMMPILFAYLGNIRWDGLLIPSTMGGLMALFLLLAYGQQPTSYDIDDRTLIVRRRWQQALRIPMNTISSVSFVPELAGIPNRGLRFAMNPGVFGYQGPFHLSPYGKAFFLATNRERLVAIARVERDTRTPLPPLIISPAYPRALVDAFYEERDTAQNAPRPD